MAQYDRFRKRYYMDGLGKPLPLAKELRWGWLPYNSNSAGITHFDEDDEPDLIELNEGLSDWTSLLKLTLLHEMSHIRLGVDVPCPSVTRNRRILPAWKEETIRLAGLGAPLL